MKPLVKVCAVMAAFTVAACGNSGGSGKQGGGTSSATPDRPVVADGTLTMALSGDPGKLDPATAVQGSTNLLLSFLYDTLVHTDQNGKIVSGLADSWTVQDKSVTFTLHKGATCSDGSPVTADDVAKSINHTVDPATKSPIVGVLVPADVSASADGTDKVTLTTKESSPFLLQSTVAMFIVCGKGLQPGADLGTTPSGSGPYTLESQTAGDHYTLQRRDHYDWGAGGTSTATKGVPAKVVLKVVTSEATAANLLLSGGVTSAMFSGVDRQRVEHASGIITSTLAGGNGEFFFNETASRVQSDVQVRKALSSALDLDALAKVISQGSGEKTIGLTTLSPRPCKVDSVTGHRPTFDVDAANQLLDAAGWTKGGDGIREKDGKKLKVTLLYNTDDGTGTASGMEYAQSQWKKLGVQTTLAGKPGAGYSEALFTTGDWDVAWVPVGLSLPSQFIGYVSGDAPPKGSNFGHIDNADYVKYATQAGSTALADGGCDVWAKAESALFDNYDVLPVVELTQLVASKNATVVMPGGLALPTLFRMYQG